MKTTNHTNKQAHKQTIQAHQNTKTTTQTTQQNTYQNGTKTTHQKKCLRFPNRVDLTPRGRRAARELVLYPRLIASNGTNLLEEPGASFVSVKWD